MASPSPIVFGDLQGCFDCLQSLLNDVEADSPGSPWWFTGDLTNRGPLSLPTLRWAYAHRERLVTVLGNHDLHLLAVSQGIRRPADGDTIDEILDAPDRDVLLDWLRRQPLAHADRGWLMVHAGLLPGWTTQQAVALSAEVQQVLAGDDWVDFLRQMYGNRPDAWDDSLAGPDRWRVIVNAMTRLRFCDAQGRMEFASKRRDADRADLLPWFDVPGRQSASTPIVFGHWSTLGLLQREDVVGLDTGCVWGGRLTAMRLDDRRVYQVDCPPSAVPDGG